MKCPNCGGTGKEYWNGNVFCNTGFECDKCNGTGEIEMTNDEWRKTCSAEEFAEGMAQYCCDVNTNDVKEILKKEWLEWLKQPHKPIS
jgi:hypothetical protein